MEFDEQYSPGYIEGAIFTDTLGSIITNDFDIGLKDYPIFDESYREPLNSKIIKHFWFREIGLETPGLFKAFLNKKMNEIMPYYNQLYLSQKLEFDPLVNIELETKGEGNSNQDESRNLDHTEDGTSKSTSTSDSQTDGKSRTLFSQTPQAQLSNYDDYATNVTDTQSDTTVHTTSDQDSEAESKYNDVVSANIKAMNDYITNAKGVTGITKSQALQLYRQTFLNIDMDIIDELEVLFMGIYTNYWNGL